MTRVLFVSYGGGHISMVLPVMERLRARLPGVETPLLALTTALKAARKAGEPAFGFADFAHLSPGFAAHGARLLASNSSPDVAEDESRAYLGINYCELEERLGPASAAARFEEAGRAAFYPVVFLGRVIDEIQPDVVVATNTPRAEAAALEAAAAKGLPTLLMNDLFDTQLEPVARRQVLPDILTVLAEPVARHFLAEGVPAERVRVTGNPAFDRHFTDEAQRAGATYRAERGWEGLRVILWAASAERMASVPEGERLDLPMEAEARLRAFVGAHPDTALIIRYHPGDWHRFPPPPAHPRLHVSPPGEEAISTVLTAADIVVTQASTVGLEAALLGKPVLTLEYSAIARDAFSYAARGLSIPCHTPDDIARQLSSVLDGLTASAGAYASDGRAAHRVADLIASLAARGQ
ncbi:MAG: UDP-N-acetylglucosamine 2-epimerase [Pseudomonadota bacterium]